MNMIQKNNKVIFIFSSFIFLLMLEGCVPSSRTIREDIQFGLKSEQQWWSVFNDHLMNDLANQLIKQNIDIKIAQTRLEEAKAFARIANSGFFPNISATANASRGNNTLGLGKPASIMEGGFFTSWEIDAFGQTRTQLDASINRVEARSASVEEIMDSVLAELFLTIIEWHRAKQVLKDASNLLSSQDNQLKLFSTRVKAGLIDASFLSRAAAQRAQTATLIPFAQASIEASQYKIEQLLGKQPGELSNTLSNASDTFTVPNMKETIEVNFSIICTRPDIRAAKFEMLAAQSDLAKAEADVWPRISLSAFFGVRDTSDGVISASNPIWSIASSIIAPVLNFERLNGAIDVANAREKQSIFVYKNVVLTAIREAKTALSDYLSSINVLNQQEQALIHRKMTVALVSKRFERGLTDMIDLTTAQSELNQATLLMVESKASCAIAYIRLQKALGRTLYDRNQS